MIVGMILGLVVLVILGWWEAFYYAKKVNELQKKLDSLVYLEISKTH